MSLRLEWITRPVAQRVTHEAQGWAVHGFTRVISGKWPNSKVDVVILYRPVNWSDERKAAA